MAHGFTNGNFYVNVRAQQALDTQMNEARAIHSRMRPKYGMHKGHWQWDLAIDFFSMSNDAFHRIYGFNFVPSGRLFTEAKAFREKYGELATLRGAW